MDPQAISAWCEEASVDSPDGRFRACIRAAIEVRMGAPTMGTLEVTELNSGEVLVRLEGCNPSLVWSQDSELLALPRWAENLSQQLAIVAVPSGVVRVVPERFRVLELHSFAGGVVRGIDSPRSVPAVLTFPVADLEPLAQARERP